MADHELLSCVFQAQGGGGTLSGDPLRHADLFFVHSVLVTPNKFRPVSVMNGTKFEHPHNVILVKVLKACLDIYDLHGGLETMREQGAHPPDIVAKFLQLSKALQNHVRTHFLLDFLSLTKAQIEKSEPARASAATPSQSSAARALGSCGPTDTHAVWVPQVAQLIDAAASERTLTSNEGVSHHVQVAQLIDATASENKDGLQGVRQQSHDRKALCRSRS